MTGLSSSGPTSSSPTSSPTSSLTSSLASSYLAAGGGGNLALDQRRARQTPQAPSTFKLAFAEGSRVLLAGAAAATRLVGLPTLSAAISRVGSDTVGTPADLETAGSALGGGTLGAGQASSRITDDLQLLALQDQIQREGRQIALVSNVMKARHETTKAAIGNIRS